MKMNSAEEIQRQIDALEKQKAELLKQKEEILNTPKALQVTASLTAEEYVCVKSSAYRSDYVDMMRSIPSRFWDSVQKHDRISLQDYKDFVAKLEKLPNISFKPSEQIEEALTSADLTVSLSNKNTFKLKVKPGVSIARHLGNLLSVAVYNLSDHHYHIPLGEGGRLLTQIPSAEWSDEAKASAQADLEKRHNLANIALATDAAEISPELNGRLLFPYQRVGVKFAVNAEGRCLIADEMGLGKTLQAIAYAQVAGCKKIAVICPAAAKENWRREIIKSTANIPIVMSGTSPNETDILLLADPTTRWYIFNYDILARPETVLKKEGNILIKEERYFWIEFINSMGFDLVITDEAHKFKNTDAGRTKAVLKLKPKKFLALTGTPVLNRPLELWPMLHILNKKDFPSVTHFERRYTDGRNGVRNLTELRTLLSKYMIRRTKTDVLKDLPPVIRTPLLITLKDKERRIYNKMMNGLIVSVQTEEIVGEMPNILTKILRIKQFLSAIKADKIAEFATDVFDESEGAHRKIVIFTQFVPIVHRIRKLLGHQALYITGEDFTPQQRQGIVDEFQTSPTKVFLVCTYQAASEALTMTAAGHVIHADFTWTPATHQQAEGRAYGRVNDPHNIDATYAAVENSMDDWLQEVLREKLATIEAVVDGTNDQRRQESSILQEFISILKSGKMPTGGIK